MNLGPEVEVKLKIAEIVAIAELGRHPFDASPEVAALAEKAGNRLVEQVAAMPDEICWAPFDLLWVVDE